MIKVRGQICYSPLPPDRYALGAVVGEDVQMWNLAYLSCSGIEDHVDPPTLLMATALVNRDFPAAYTALAALTGQACTQLFPQLRQALQQHPTVFLQRLWVAPWDLLPQMREIPDWHLIVIDKVADIEARAKQQLRSMITGVEGNVTTLNFGGGR